MDSRYNFAGHAPAGLRGVAYLAAAALDARGDVREWTPGAQRLLGYPPEELLGRPLAGLLDADVDPEVRRRLFERDGGVARVVMRHRDGRPIGVELYSRIVRDEGGTPCRLLIATALPNAADLQEPLTRWAVDQIPFLATIVDPDLRYVHANDQAARGFDIPAAELLGKTLMDIFPTASGARITEDMRRAIQSNRPSVVRVNESLPDRPTTEWAVYNTPLTDPSGQVRGLYSLGIDTTIENAALKRLRLLNQASATIGSTLNVRRTAEELAEVFVPDLADFVVVDLLDSAFAAVEPGPGAAAGRPGAERPPALLRRQAARSVIEGCPEAVLRPGETDTYPDFSIHAQALATGRSFITPIMGVPSFDQWAGFNKERSQRSRAYGIHSAMVVPIKARGTTLGIAVFTRHQRPEGFDNEDLLLAEEVTGRAAVCLDNALRYSQERATALTLQHSLLPQRLPRQVAVEVAGRYLPSDVHGGVGGDWFDLIPLSGARVALVVGDVVGHGIHASATMGRLRTAVRTLADLEMQPDELLAHLDDIVGRPFDRDPAVDGQVDADVGATCLYAVYNPANRSCSMARAGHPPPALVLPDGGVEVLDVPAGPPLGVGGLPFENFETTLPEGSLLALYTDGLIESRGGDIDAGLAALREQLSQPADSLEDLCDAVLGALLPPTPADDVALLIARTRVLDRGHVASWEFPADPVVVKEAREAVAAQLTEWGLDEARFTTEVVVSELVTNAMRHGSGPIGLRMILEDSLICEVSDGSSTFPHLRRAHMFDEGGRGLLLVAQLSERWGTRPTETGKVIWSDQTIPHLQPPNLLS